MTFIETLKKKHSETVKTYIKWYYMDDCNRLYRDCHIGSLVTNTAFLR